MIHREAELQSACVRYFRLRWPKLSGIFFAIPNGGSRNPIEARNLKIQGTLSGVADLILLKPSNGYGALCIEMKSESGRQSISQKEFQSAAQQAGNRYVVCRTFEEFRKSVEEYLQ
jgi:hypothetical protein